MASCIAALDVMPSCSAPCLSVHTRLGLAASGRLPCFVMTNGHQAVAVDSRLVIAACCCEVTTPPMDDQCSPLRGLLSLVDALVCNAIEKHASGHNNAGKPGPLQNRTQPKGTM